MDGNTTYTITMRIEVDDDVYWPEWVKAGASWNDSLGYLLNALEKVEENIPGVRLISMESDDPNWVKP